MYSLLPVIINYSCIYIYIRRLVPGRASMYYSSSELGSDLGFLVLSRQLVSSKHI